MVHQATAKLNGKTLATTENWEFVEGNVYFPPASLDKSILSKSNTTTYCPWKGNASYYNVTVDGKEIKDAAWYYPEPMEKAKHLKDYVAFYKSKVEVERNE